MPRLSVVMPAYKASATIERAIRSTVRAMPEDAELVVGIDGPDEDTEAAARRIEDPRVRVLAFGKNRGSVACTRELLLSTDSDVVAKMDADDLCAPWRFRVQIRALRAAEIVCGAGVRFGSGIIPRPSYLGSLTTQEISAVLPFTNPLFHPSLVARRSTMLAADAYAHDSAAEDYVLWLDALRLGARIVKISTPVIAYRLSPGQISGAPDYARAVQQDREVRRAAQQWAEATGQQWLVGNGEHVFRTDLTPQQCADVLARVRPVNRPYVRRQLRLHTESAAAH